MSTPAIEILQSGQCLFSSEMKQDLQSDCAQQEVIIGDSKTCSHYGQISSCSMVVVSKQTKL